MAEVDDPIVDMEYQSSALKSEDSPGVFPEDDFHMVDIKPTETVGVKKKYSKGPKRPQQKKELYVKLDEILFTALRQEFEVAPGYTIDRLDMVKFLTSVVHQHLSDCPDLDKLLNLRDTVLTGRVKKVFPEVEYKRKQIKQDHYRKAWLYVNIRRKPSRTTHDGEVKIVSVSTTSTWTPPVAPGSTPVSQASSSPSSPGSEEQSPSPHACNNSTFEHCSSNTLATDKAGALQSHGEPEQSGSGSDGVAPSFGPQLSIDCRATERTGVVFDNSTLQKWVISNYIQDNLAYVPVQDVVKAFKRDFGVDITYKECHQMILSAFTSPRNRLIPKKNVRVSSVGQQYVYRGIAVINKGVCTLEESQDVDESDCAQSNYQSEDAQGETEENWKQRIRDIADERDQALKERNQALAALMELEKDHTEALGTIEKLKKENSCSRCVGNSPKTLKETPSIGRETSTNHHKSSSFGKLLRSFGDTKRDLLSQQDQHPDRHEDRCDYSFLKEVVTQAKDERDSLLRRLEIVKTERNSYLERLHSLEKENQRLRDAVSVRHSDVSRHRLLDDISLHFQTNCHSENDTKEAALSSVLAHLKSKRKQVAPSRLNKSPKFDHASANEHNSLEDQRTHASDCLSPAGTVDSGIPSPENLGASNGELLSDKDRVLYGDNDKLSSNIERNVDGEKPGNKQDLLVFTSGSGMIGFTRHPLED